MPDSLTVQRGRTQSISSPLRVLSVIHPFRPAFSGAGEWWLRMIPVLRRRGVNVEVLTAAADTGIRRRQPELIDGVVVHRVGIHGDSSSWWRWVRAITGELVKRRRRFDIVVFHSPNRDAVYAACIMGRVLGWKTILRMTLFRSDDLISILNSGRFGRFRLSALRLADGFISISERFTRTFEQTGLRPAHLLKVPQGVDTRRFRPTPRDEKRQIRERLGIPENVPVTLFCGAVVRRKGVDILIEAWRRVSMILPDAILLLVGPNHHDLLTEPEYQAFSKGIERRIEELALTDRVRLVGFHEEIEKFYAAADVFVLPSRAEGCPNVMMEAMASGLPCIVSELEGTSDEHLRDGREGVIVRSEDAAEYAGHILSLLTDPELARQLGEAARKRAEESYSVEHIGDRYAAFFHRVAQANGRRSGSDIQGTSPA